MKKTIIALVVGLVLLAVTVVGSCLNVYNTGIAISGGTNIEVIFSDDITKEEYAKTSVAIETALKKAGYDAKAVPVLSGNDYEGIHFAVNKKFTEGDADKIETAVSSVYGAATVYASSAKTVGDKPYGMMLIALLIALVLTALYVLLRTFKKDKCSAMLTVITNAVIAVAFFGVIELILSLIGLEFSYASVAMSALVFIASSAFTFMTISGKRDSVKTCRLCVLYAIAAVLSAVLVMVLGGSLTVAIELLIAFVLPLIACPMTNAFYNVAAEGKNN